MLVIFYSHGGLRLVVSGYNSDIIFSKGIIEADVDFIPKLFERNDLLQKVREVLDRQA